MPWKYFCMALYVEMLFVDFTCAFNTIIPSRMVSRLHEVGVSQNHAAGFRTIYQSIESILRAPLGCVLSTLLYTLYTHDCTSNHNKNTIIKLDTRYNCSGTMSLCCPLTHVLLKWFKLCSASDKNTAVLLHTVHSD